MYKRLRLSSKYKSFLPLFLSTHLSHPRMNVYSLTLLPQSSYHHFLLIPTILHPWLISSSLQIAHVHSPTPLYICTIYQLCPDCIRSLFFSHFSSSSSTNSPWVSPRSSYTARYLFYGISSWNSSIEFILQTTQFLSLHRVD